MIDQSETLNIQGGRHPVLDSGAFISNSILLDNERRQMILTGPNMGGKSTFMRQTALLIILGQMGCPIPATQAHWGSVSSILTRIGAKDAIAKGQSTFMVEMNELAAILNEADIRSLLILDEIGRGTSTFDGISVAWSSLEWIAKSIRCRTLFATHYHELTRLSLAGIFNCHMAVEGSKTRDSKLRFLFEVREGASNESFGIQVAQLAGLPKGVIARAWQVLENLERENRMVGTDNPDQLSIFGTVFGAPSVAAHLFGAAPVAAHLPEPELPESDSDIVKTLRGININETSPMEALRLLAQLQTEVKD